MSHNHRMYHKLIQQFRQWHPEKRVTQVRNMALLVMGMYLSRSVHMGLIVRKWEVRSQLPSLENRLRRLLCNPLIAIREWYRPVAQSIIQAFAGQQLRLLLDCTKVGFGHRLLTVSIAYRRRALPLLWSVHKGSKGHVKVRDQINLLKSVLPWLPRKCSVWVMGDAGFQSPHLLQWLARQHWHFVMRQQGRIKVYLPGRGWCSIHNLDLAEGQTRYLGWVRLTEKYQFGWVWLILHWEHGEDEPWYLVCSCRGKRRLLQHYRRRMWTEEMYGDMKKHGFDLEATHLRHAERITRLVLGVCIAFVWLLTLGSWVIKRGLRHWVDRRDRRDKSYFRIGWDWIEHCLRLNLPLRLHFRPLL